jgi:hypothetical protein
MIVDFGFLNGRKDFFTAKDAEVAEREAWI